MSEAKFKTLRHIETVRNYLSWAAKQLIDRAVRHDQSKLETPEVEEIEEHTHKLRSLVYGSQEYKKALADMRPAIEHHYAVNRHHPEYHEIGIDGMDLFDLMEMMCDWKAAGMRHDTGCIFKSLEINKTRYAISDQLYRILVNTAYQLEKADVYHKAMES